MNTRELLQEDTIEFAFKSRSTERGTQPSGVSRTTTFGRKRGKSPQQFNGMHRRRRKKNPLVNEVPPTVLSGQEGRSIRCRAAARHRDSTTLAELAGQHVRGAPSPCEKILRLSSTRFFLGGECG